MSEFEDLASTLTNLRKFREFFQAYPEIQQTLSVKSLQRLPQDANIFASKYQLYLPSKEELKAQLEQITHDLEGGAQQ